KLSAGLVRPTRQTAGDGVGAPSQRRSMGLGPHAGAAKPDARNGRRWGWGPIATEEHGVGAPCGSGEARREERPGMGVGADRRGRGLGPDRNGGAWGWGPMGERRSPTRETAGDGVGAPSQRRSMGLGPHAGAAKPDARNGRRWGWGPIATEEHGVGAPCGSGE